MLEASSAPPETTGGVIVADTVHEQVIRKAIAGLDLAALTQRFREQNEFIFLEKFLPQELVAAMTEEARRLTPRAYRRRVPWVRKAGTVGQALIANEAPLLNALYHSPSFLAFAQDLCGAPLTVKHERDAHAATLYVYKRAGDHVGWHYDDCGCEGEASYTATVGLINDSQSVVQFRLWESEPSKAQELSLPASPGSLAFFCGSKVYHRVTPLREGEERVVYSFSHVTAGKRLTGVRRFKENFWDALLYFGPKAIFQKNY
jgi:alkylated DNA repair dioxygenase AlkB